MPEAVVGAKLTDIVHQKKTAEGSLTIAYNPKDIVANTIGHVLAVPTTHTILWTWGSAFKNPSKELAGKLFERYKDVPWKGDVLVRVGHVSLMGDLQRMFARNETIRGRPWMLKDRFGRAIEFVGKLGVAFLTTLNAIKAKLMRSDYFNPFANTVAVFHPKLAAGMHELGHAEWFNQMDRNQRVAYSAVLTNALVYVPFFRSFIEWQATANAMKHYVSDAERRQALKMHEAAWATYLGFDALATLSLVAPAFALPLLKAAITITGKLTIGTKLFTAAIGTALHPYSSSIAGHLVNRLYPKKDQRFGYIFEGKKGEKRVVEDRFRNAKNPAPQPQTAESMSQEKNPLFDLKPHQILQATARAVPEQRQFVSGGDRNGKQKLHSNYSRVTF